MLLIFILSGVVGNTFAVCFAGMTTPSLGASTSIFGIFGGMAGFVCLNWFKLPTTQRGYLICIVVFIIIMNFLFGMGTAPKQSPSQQNGSQDKPSNDILAHVGGLLAGIFLGMFCCDLNEINSGHAVFEKRVKLIGIALFTLYTVLSVLGIYVFQ